MGYRYASRKSKKTDAPQAGQAAAKAVSQTPGVPMETTRSMLMQKAMADRSHRIDLPDAMREKMESAFGINFGKVNLYESEKVADAGANAIAQGGNIAFAPGKDDFNSLDGQRRLGHELSHVAAQARGEVTGSGFLDNGALEARADREGALAASGEQVYSGPMMDAPSFAGASAPMQADDDEMAEMFLNKMLSIRKALNAVKTVGGMERSTSLTTKEARKAMRASGSESKIKQEDYDWYKKMLKNPTQSLMKALQGKQDKELGEAKLRFDNEMRPYLSNDALDTDGPQRNLDTFDSANKLSDEAKKNVADRLLMGDTQNGSNSMQHANALLDLMDDFNKANKKNKEYQSWGIEPDAYTEQIRFAKNFAEQYGSKNAKDWSMNSYAQDYLNYGENKVSALSVGERPEEPKHHKQMYRKGGKLPKKTAEEVEHEKKLSEYYARTDDGIKKNKKGQYVSDGIVKLPETSKMGYYASWEAKKNKAGQDKAQKERQEKIKNDSYVLGNFGKSKDVSGDSYLKVVGRLLNVRESLSADEESKGKGKGKTSDEDREWYDSVLRGGDAENMAEQFYNTGSRMRDLLENPDEIQADDFKKFGRYDDVLNETPKLADKLSADMPFFEQIMGDILSKNQDNKRLQKKWGR